MSGTQGSAEPGTIQSKKQELVRREIWAAAMVLFISAGFDETTVGQIAKQANISRRTFFRYFSSKEDVMAAAMKGYGAALVNALRDQPRDLPLVDAAKAVVKRVSRLATESPFARDAMQVSERSPAARSAQLMEIPVIEDELALMFASRGKAKDEIMHRLLATVTLSVTNLTIYRWLCHPSLLIDDVVDEAFEALTRMCCGGGAVKKSPADKAVRKVAKR